MTATGYIAVVCIIAVVVVLTLVLIRLPGKIARRRYHPSADAINVCALVGIVLWPAWVVALIWAHTGVDGSTTPARRKAAELAAAKRPTVRASSMNYPGA